MKEEKIFGVPHGVAYCQQSRTEELSERIRNRNIPSAVLEPLFSPRPVTTKYTILPILDERKKPSIELNTYPIYTPEQIFNPGNTLSPWSGYASAINVESSLRNQFFARQRCDRSVYIPSSNSELFNVRIDSTIVEQRHPLLFKNENFEKNEQCFKKTNKVFNNTVRSDIHYQPTY